jgi:phosphatidylserine decarboxylase
MVNQKKLSALFGWLANGHIPHFMLPTLIRKYIKSFDIDMSQFNFDIQAATSFNEFFIRPLKPGMRTFKGVVSAAADGYVSAFGAIKNKELFQVKGSYFSLQELTGQKLSFSDGSFITIYLSPGDYHRVHMPFDATITSLTHIPGRLFSVNPATVQKIDKLYCKNERIVIEGISAAGRFYLVLVGAIIVGKIKLSFTTEKLSFNETHTVHIPLRLGDEVGYFELGSTIVLAVESSDLQDLPFSPHQKIRMGTQLC